MKKALNRGEVADETDVDNVADVVNVANVANEGFKPRRSSRCG